LLKRLTIDNFRGLRRFDAPLDAVTAFLGPNSSGKTTALHAVRLACDLLMRAVESDRPARRETYDGQPWIEVTADTLLGDPAKLLALADWEALFGDQEVGTNVQFKIELGFEAHDPIQAVHVVVACVRNQQLKFDVRVRAEAATEAVKSLSNKSPVVHRTLTEYLKEHAPRAVFIPPFYGTVPAEEVRNRAVIDRLLGSGDQSHVVRNLVVRLSARDRDDLSAFLTDTVGVRLETSTGGDALESEPTLRVTFKDTNGPLELSAAGAGLINLVALYAALLRQRQESARRPVIFLIDEPEAHLHPRLQAESASRMASLVTRDFGAQLLLATHSIDILNRLSEEGGRLLRCNRNATPSVQALESDASLFEELSLWADLTPYTAINFLASRRVVFVEGKDELNLLPRLGELRFRHDLARLRQFRRWALVEFKGAANQNQADLLDRLLRSDVIRQGAPQGAFQAVVVLDRDYARTPGTTTVAGAGVSQTTIVWSVHSLEALLATPPVLSRWIRARLGDLTPPDIEARVQQAVEAADRDEGLNRDAVARLAAAGVEALYRSGAAILADNMRAMRKVTEDAQQTVQAAPAAWQHGKQRGEFILRQIWAGLDQKARALLPVDVCRLIELADAHRIGDTLAAIPAEVNALLERLAQQ
jgi:hypothetical protein